MSPSDSEANRDGSESSFPLFFSLLRTLAREKRSENCFRFGTGGPSLWLYLLLSRKYNILPRANNGCSCEKKILAKRFAHASCSRHQRESALSRFEARLRILNLIAWLC